MILNTSATYKLRDDFQDYDLYDMVRTSLKCFFFVIYCKNSKLYWINRELCHLLTINHFQLSYVHLIIQYYNVLRGTRNKINIFLHSLGKFGGFASKKWRHINKNKKNKREYERMESKWEYLIIQSQVYRKMYIIGKYNLINLTMI